MSRCPPPTWGWEKCILTEALSKPPGDCQGAAGAPMRIIGFVQWKAAALIQSRCYLSSKESRKSNRKPKRERSILTTEMREDAMENMAVSWVLKRGRGQDFRGWKTVVCGVLNSSFSLRKRKKLQMKNTWPQVACLRDA